MKLIFFILLLVFLPVLSNATTTPIYTINEIADSLTRNAGAVVRLDNVTLNVRDTHKYTYTEEKVISILNSSQEGLAEVQIAYDEQRESIKSFKAWIYDAEGKLVKHLDKADAYDFSATPGYVLAGQERVKVWDLNKQKTPYTIRYTYELDASGTFQLPFWLPAHSNGISIEQATFNLTCGEDVSINYKAEGVTDNNTNKHNFLWQTTGFSALKRIEYATGYWTLLPHVFLMAKEFEIYGHTGRSDSWNDIGIFMNALMKDREKLDAVEDPKLNAIISTDTSKKEKVRLIYNYLQNNFRYVCVSLGIGGWQPQEASFTMKKKYGDCKALSMVMKAMLKKAGIESCLTLISAGDNDRVDLTPDFPHSYFNHAILCVPLPKDTIWLECTSPTTPFNYLGGFTCNRKALMIFENGARIVQTPAYDETENIKSFVAQIKPNADNSTSITATVTSQNKWQDNLRSIIDLKDAKKIESAVYDVAQLRNTSINSYSVTRVEPDKPSIQLTLNLHDGGSIRKTDSRLFVKTDIFKPAATIPVKDDYRTQKVDIKAGFTQFDTLIYSLPAGYIPENFKAEEVKEYSGLFGSSNCTIKYVAETGELTLIRKFCLKQAIYPANQYQPLREFLLKSMKLCCPELVLKNGFSK